MVCKTLTTVLFDQPIGSEEEMVQGRQKFQIGHSVHLLSTVLVLKPVGEVKKGQEKL